MVGKVSSMLLDNVTYSRTHTGSVAIHLSPVPRFLFAGIGALVVGLIAAAFLPLSLTPVAALLAATFAFALAGRPSTLFDCTRGVMVRYFKRIPFADLDHFHAIERRDEEPRMSGFAELLAGPRIVVRYEVYTRLRGEPLVVGYCRTKATATELVSAINTILTARH